MSEFIDSFDQNGDIQCMKNYDTWHKLWQLLRICEQSKRARALNTLLWHCGGQCCLSRIYRHFASLMTAASENKLLILICFTPAAAVLMILLFALGSDQLK